ncbi:receptor-type tyrosine-protein phosphatase delta-like isoform X1 [Lytechinus variegatus]|uniref:receptor-type tyrosine-protein phosphatase delta-like isoform X1 n=1 Tax=Lytechinus variegatus TaxID=7654 RepID=UPI001BB25F62|nr:receptor-type tyrosine-protein phosphatase delta-like isoform X1 [Lytechinus variegatus]
MGYSCNCTAGYTGANCSTDINDCELNPCLNGGTCTDMINGFTCTCVTGYTELNCSIDINECLSNLCMNGATCNDLVNGYNCTCAEGFNGTFCDTDINACEPDPCVNAVNCTNHLMNEDDATYTCLCLPGWMGQNCSEDIRECNSTPCANGGTCIEGTDSFNCTCAPGYNGTYCENICPPGTFGDYCVESCTCVDGANCSNVDGSCTCEPAFDTAVCDKQNVSVSASLTPEPPNNTISEYDVFTLACQVNLAEIDLEEFMWTRNDVELPTNNSNPKYLVSRNPDTGMYNITIRNASAEDTGSYVCTAVTAGRQFNASSDTIEVNVIVQGQIDRELSKFEDRIQLNQTASLNCTVFSSSEASIAWERYGMRLENGTNRASIEPGSVEGIGGMYFFSVLEISEIVRADNGIYTCLALDAEDNETDRADFTIFVQEVPELDNPRIMDVLSTQVTLSWDFTVQGNDDDINCTATYSYQVKNEATNGTGEQDVGGTSPCDVINLTPYATYTFQLTCVNLVGRSEPLVFDSVDTQVGKPSPPRNVSVPIGRIEARQVFVQWVEPEIKNGPIESYIVRAIHPDGLNRDVIKTITPPTGTTTTLGNLTPYTTYEITVRASNILAGTLSEESEHSDPFTTLEAEPGEPDEFDVTDNESECIVSWKIPQEPNGVITGYTLYTEIKRRDTGDIVSSQRSDRGVQLGASFMISTLELYSIYRYSVSASTTIGEGPNATSSSLCETPSGGPLLPPALPTPDEGDITQTSFTVALPTYDARNGPVSCYEVIVVRLEDVAAGASLDSSTPTYQPDQIKSYQEARDKTGVPYRAVVFKDRPTSGMLVVGATENNVSTCYTGGSAGSGRRRRRETVAVEDLTAVNGPLEAGGTYSSFVRVYIPSEADRGMAFYENGPFMSPVELASRSNVAAIVGGIFGALIAVCIVGVVVLIFYRRKQNEPNDLLMTPVSNGPRENGNGAIGMQNLGIEDADDMIVKPIRLENLEKAIRQKAQDEKRIFWAEYKALPNRPPPMVTMNNSNLPANKDKNRYINIIAYDHTRVRLKAIDGIEGSDYINASYVNGYQSPDKFIAAQGPKDNTIEDFWRMIWEYDCSTIVMLTKCVEDGKDKCSQYWPNKGAIKYGRFKVKMDSVKETAEYLIRSLLLSEDGKESGERTITQFHFLGWPDHGQPDYPSPMMCLIKRVRHLTSKMNHRANIVVHCSAGVGRTGTYIVIDAMLDMMKHEKQVDVYNFIHDIRQQRNTLVQSFVQYFFIHMALLEEHLFGHSDVAMSEFPMYYQQLSNKSEFDDDLTKLEVEFRRACKLGVNGVEQRFANIEQNKDKNRIGHILPYDKNVVKLERLIGEEFSDYINASYITGYQRKNMYIATQGPLPNTISDFWRMIWESQTATIVMLTEMSQKGHEMCAQYWPLEMDETEEHGNISVTLVSESDEDDAFTIRDIEISHAKIMQNIYGNVDTRNEESAEGAEGAETDSQSAIYGNVDESAPPTPMKDIRKIRQYHFRGWPEVGVPESGADLMHLVNQSHLHQKEAGPGPIVVHCSAGAGRTGVFIALNILMSRMEEESMIDVFQTVRGLRQQRPHMVQDLAQFKFCYSAMVEYLESQSTEYQNFVARV